MGSGHIHIAPTLAPSVIRDVGRTGWLESTALAIALLAAAVAVAGAAFGYAWWRRKNGVRTTHRVRRRVVNVLVGAIVGVLALSGSAVAVNSYVGYVPTLGSVVSSHLVTPFLAAGKGLKLDRKGQSSRVVEVSIPAPSLGLGSLPAYVYLPPGYSSPANAHRRYPTLYLIHGHPGHASDWFLGGRVQRTMDILLRDHLVGPMIVVGPSASPNWLQDTECLNAVHGPQMESYLTQVVPAAINRDFRTRIGRAYTGIGGMSSGAYCALNLGLRHPHEYSLVAASEPYTSPGKVAFAQMLAMNRPLLWANSPGRYLPAVHLPLPQAFFLDAGSGDRHTYPNLALLSHELANDGQDVVVRVVPNAGHTWRTARLELPYALVFASQRFGRMPSGGSVAGDARFDRELLSLGAMHATAPAPARTPAPQKTGGGGVPTTPSPSPSPLRSRAR